MSTNNTLTPGTQLALLQAAQGETAQVTKSLKSLGDAKKLEHIEGAAQEFEAVFIAEMLKPMFEGISTDGQFGGGKGEEVFRDMMVQEYGKIIARTGSIGIADPVKDHMIKIQEQNTNES